MIILLFAVSVSLFSGFCLWASGTNRCRKLDRALDADSEIPDTVPTEWVDAYRAEKKRRLT